MNIIAFFCNDNVKERSRSKKRCAAEKQSELLKRKAQEEGKRRKRRKEAHLLPRQKIERNGVVWKTFKVLSHHRRNVSAHSLANMYTKVIPRTDAEVSKSII